jgi:type II secretory pathway component PulF
VSRAYGIAARGPLGTYNFSGDLGKAAIAALTSVLLALMRWRQSLWLIAALGLATAAATLATAVTALGGQLVGRMATIPPGNAVFSEGNATRFLRALSPA